MYNEWKAGVLHRRHSVLAEGPFWDEPRQALFFVDIEGRSVCCLHPATGAFREWEVGRRTGFAIPSATNSSLLLGLQGGLVHYDIIHGKYNLLARVEQSLPENRCNDGKCDASGRLWFGTMDVQARLSKGALYRYDGQLVKVLDNISVSNGMGWSPDNQTFYYIDSLDYNIKAFDFDLESGTLGRERIVTGTDFIPDGMCVDSEGMLWVAMWGEGCVYRYHPEKGRVIGKVLVDAPHVSSCAFGGPGMNSLFITTAREGLTAEQLHQFPDSGSVFSVDLPVRGLAAHSFSIPALCI